MTEPTDSSSSDVPHLQALGQTPPPEDLLRALRGIMALPAATVQALPELLASVLEPLAEDQLDNRIIRYARRLDVAPETLAPAVKGSRFLLRSAAAEGCSSEQLRADLAALGPKATGLTDLLGPIFEAALPNLRGELVSRALGAHGRVFAGCEWRIDTIGASSQAKQIGVPVAMLTLHYQEQGQAKAITLQLLPDMVASLRDTCNKILA